ncbi:MAG: O-methyltransferase [Bacteroidetes bacterium]|nr:MAG: O-methyltransferase [Bacteroidota bacterium]
MEFLPELIQQYAENHSDKESDLLQKIAAETQKDVAMPRMISGHYQGRFLSMISAMIQPKLILEIGTYTGYSALCMAEHLAENGKIITIDKNNELEKRVRGYFSESKYNQQIDYRIGNAIEIIPKLEETDFDIVFIDADKINYTLYYDLVFEKVKSGGFIIADNVLWSGKVVEDKKDKKTEAIKAFNQKINEDVRVENLLLAIRDGLMIARKK